ncbi:cytochrome P450 [Kitasatospora sp. NPDC085895]|uniref:cytochrome P450 n=1 Tax=Kitasatospora sp. NPDC085895 TaxID=3155057 RepID=UPI00344E01B6
MTGTASTAIDLSDPGLFVRGEHHEAFRRLRAEEPVWWNRTADGGFWALTTYDDIVAVYRDHATFSSEGGAILGGSLRSERDTAAGRMLVATDPPRHRMLRAQMHPAFAPEMIGRTREQVELLVDAALERALADGGCDFVTDVAAELPAGALMAMADIGHTDAHHLIGLTRRMMAFREAGQGYDDSDARIRLAEVQSEIFDFFADLMAERRRRPGADFVSMLLAAEVNGRRLSESDVLYNCMNIAVGGNETTLYTACAGLAAFMEHPGEFDRLVADPGLLDTALEELLRWGSVNAYVQRIALKDTEIGGRLIRRGESVTLWNVSGNRDEKQFPAADRFDVARTPNRHLALGNGVHRCVGAPTGLAELGVLFGRLAEQGIRAEEAGPMERLQSNFILGITRLPVTLTRTRP